MTLDYLYVHDVGNLKKVEFNFRKDLSFSFNAETNELTIKKNAWYGIEDFFDESILGMNAIIGDNRVGKTTLLSTIFLGIGNQYEKQIAVFGNYIYSHGFPIRVSSDNEVDYVTIGQESIQKFLNIFGESFQIAYFSNSIYHQDFRGSGKIFPKSYSTRDVMRRDVKMNPLRWDGDWLAIHKFKDLSRQIAFLDWAEKHEIQLPFGNLSFISIFFKDDFPANESGLIIVGANEHLSWCYDRIKKNQEKYLPRERDEVVTSIDPWVWKEEMGARIFRYLIQIGAGNRKGKSFVAPKSTENFHSAYLNAIEQLVIINTEDQGALKNSASIIEQFQRLIATISDLRVVKPQSHYSFPNFEYGEFDYMQWGDQWSSQVDRILLLEILENSDGPVDITDMLEFSWGLSSGEWAFLNLLSRVFDAYNSGGSAKPDENTTTEESTKLLLFDEPCLHFHPEWQRNLVKHFVDLIPKILEGQKCQIIFTTHSPLTVADLPKEHVIVMRRDEFEKITVEPLLNHESTLGGDPFTLYSKVFRIKDNYFSGYARQKLDEIFAPIVEQRNPNREEIAEMHRFADMVGDETVRFKLKELINENDEWYDQN